MTGCKKLIIVLLIVLVILLMLIGAGWSAEIKDPARKGLSDDSSLKRGLRDKEAFRWYLGHPPQNEKMR